VKEISKKIGFGNPFDATKLDNKNLLPEIMIENDYALIHLGGGNHQFIKGIDKVYHKFEPMQNTIQWDYKKSILNEYNSSESNTLSVANNQRILHYFLFGEDTEFDNVDILQRPKTYFPHRTKTSFSYNFGKALHLNMRNIQIEVDLTIEFKGKIGVFEGKNGIPDDFLFIKFIILFYIIYKASLLEQMVGKIKEIYGIYVVKSIEGGITNLKIWAYTFENPLDITSIKFVKSACYQLII